MVGLFALTYILDQQFEYWTNALENKMTSIYLVFKWHSNTKLDWYSDPHCTFYHSFTGHVWYSDRRYYIWRHKIYSWAVKTKGIEKNYL